MYFLKVKGQKSNQKKSGFERMKEPYRKLLVMSLRKPYILLLSIVVMFIMAMWGFSFVPAMFMGESNDPQIFANIELPLGTSIERTEEVVSDIERFIRDSLYTKDNKRLGVEKWSSYIGEGPPAYVLGFMPPEASPNWAHMLIYTTSGDANQ
jgi:multidrug efflux pump subunit AcrB